MVGRITHGMFNGCCGSRAGGGGAPPYRPYYDEEKEKVWVLVKRVIVKAVDKKKTTIQVKLLDKLLEDN